MATKKRKKRKKKAGDAPAKKPAKKVTRKPVASRASKTSLVEERREAHRFSRYAPWIAIAALVAGFVVWQTFPAGRAVPEDLVLRVIASYPHDTEAFTQGLLWHDGYLYESTGLYERSRLRKVDLESGEVLEEVSVDDSLFAEGLARVGDRLVQLTWRAGTALVWDLETLEKRDEWEYDGEGWGLCHDGERLVMTSGNDRLQFRDPSTFEKLGDIRVTRAGRRLRRLNELECVDGAVYANIWMDDHIARIDPATGEVTAWIDAGGLLDEDERTDSEMVLNGIAYVPETGHFILTGKNWPRVFEVVFEERGE